MNTSALPLDPPAHPIIYELASFTALTPAVVWRRICAGTDATADSYRVADDIERWYRDTNAYLFELAAYEGDPLKTALARQMAQTRGVSGLPVLDYGCGIGTFALEMVAAGMTVAAADINRPNQEFLRFRVRRRGLERRLLVADPETALTQHETFGIVSCQHVLEHVADPAELLARLRDTLVPGGAFYGVAPFDLVGPAYPEHRPDLAHLRLEDLCEQAGLHVAQTLPFGNLGEYTFTLVVAVR